MSQPAISLDFFNQRLPQAQAMEQKVLQGDGSVVLPVNQKAREVNRARLANYIAQEKELKRLEDTHGINLDFFRLNQQQPQ